MSFRDEFDRICGVVEQQLGQHFREKVPQSRLLDAMSYSLMAGGKRIRPVLLLKFCEEAGGDAEKALPLACAVEMLHTYSLIHDDLPVMDNDDLRRGKPTCHKVYGECTATLAGDALQTAAFEVLLSADLAPESVIAAGRYFAKAAGAAGMCGGQELDTSEYLTRDAAGLTLINDLKTGALIRAACVIGVIAAGKNAGDGQLQAAENYGIHLARAFQIRDDVLDVVSNADTLGKPAGSDAANNKATYASVYGLDRCRDLIAEETKLAISAVTGKFEDWSFFAGLAESLEERKS